jgi:hypothetical protein
MDRLFHFPALFQHRKVAPTLQFPELPALGIIQKTIQQYLKALKLPCVGGDPQHHHHHPDRAEQDRAESVCDDVNTIRNGVMTCRPSCTRSA